MANITIRHIRRGARHDGGQPQMTEVAGEIAIVNRNNAYPVGSFGLRCLKMIEFPSSFTARRALIGSVSGAVKFAGGGEPAYGNSVTIIPIVTGTSGTRVASSINTIGSAFPTGTVVSSFRAYGLL